MLYDPVDPRSKNNSPKASPIVGRRKVQQQAATLIGISPKGTLDLDAYVPLEKPVFKFVEPPVYEAYEHEQGDILA